MGEKEGIDARVLERFCYEEALSMTLYRELARIEKDPDRKRILLELARDEEKHYDFWSRLSGRECKPSRLLIALFKASYRLLGPVFTIRILEKGEDEAVSDYSSIAERVSGTVRGELLKIIEDEKRHEAELVRLVSDPRIKYLGSIALGIADAIVEITGVEAGFLGATESPIVVGLSGLIVGFSASLSMAGASYLQSKHGGMHSPVKNALVTGVSYMASVLALILPFFTVPNVYLAFYLSAAISVLISGFFTYYSSIVEEREFRREIVENLSLLFAIVASSYVLGDIIGSVMGLPKGL
ncbi:VIT1/CCC1 transporter family protein [Thermogladius sp. 4427co]|uniref:VIT1/CCC1 transporter family protein n=1 Tax=Thermogladius sp. 4427co TaxID=3450718 RepID=UPI003F7B3390